MARPKVILKCVAQQYAGQEERIVEFSHKNGGGLISLTPVDDKLVVHVYRTDKSVIVCKPKKRVLG